MRAMAPALHRVERHRRREAGGCRPAIPGQHGLAVENDLVTENQAPRGEPPDVVPTVALLCIPATIAGALLLGLAGPVWSLAALAVGVFFFVALVGWWSTDHSVFSWPVTAAAACMVALLLGGGVVGISVFADRLLPTSSSTTTTTSVPTTTSTRPPPSTSGTSPASPASQTPAGIAPTAAP